MAEYVEDSYHEGNVESGHYEGSKSYEALGSYGGYGNYKESGNYEGSENYRGNENFQGDSYKVHPEDTSRNSNIKLDAFLKRKQEKFETAKLNYEVWDNDRQFRTFTIVPRAWWRATPPSHSAPLQHPVDKVVMTYSHGRTCINSYFCSREAKRMQQNHLQNGAVDIVYNFMIGGNGQVFEGRGWYSSPRLNHKLQRFSRNSLHIAFLGNLRDIMPSEEMFQAAHELLEFGVRKQFITPKFLEFTTKLWTVARIPSESEVLNNIAGY